MSTNRDFFFENPEEDDFCYHLLTDEIEFDDEDCEFVTTASAASTTVALAALSSRAPLNTQKSIPEKNKSPSTDAKTSGQASSTFSASASASITFSFATSHSEERPVDSEREEVISESNFAGIST